VISQEAGIFINIVVSQISRSRRR